MNYQGIYCDANSLWGAQSEIDLRYMLEDASIDYVEAALYAWPHPGKPGYTDERTMYLSGVSASHVAALFTNGYWTPEICKGSAKERKRLRTLSEAE